jgi:hypothetical protein
MAEDAAPARTESAEVLHERSDIDLRRISMWIIGLAVLLAVTLVFLIWLFGYFNNREIRLGRSSAGIPAKAPQSVAPRLQVSPRNDLSEMRATEDKILHSYGWIDKQKGVVRIPIERAMELTAQRDLPTSQKK